MLFCLWKVFAFNLNSVIVWIIWTSTNETESSFLLSVRKQWDESNVLDWNSGETRFVLLEYHVSVFIIARESTGKLGGWVVMDVLIKLSQSTQAGWLNILMRCTCSHVFRPSNARNHQRTLSLVKVCCQAETHLLQSLKTEENAQSHWLLRKSLSPSKIKSIHTRPSEWTLLSSHS